jgi:hypothetical protein
MHFFGRWASEDKTINLAFQLEEAQPRIDKVPPAHVSMMQVLRDASVFVLILLRRAEGAAGGHSDQNRTPFPHWFEGAR